MLIWLQTNYIVSGTIRQPSIFNEIYKQSDLDPNLSYKDWVGEKLSYSRYFGVRLAPFSSPRRELLKITNTLIEESEPDLLLIRSSKWIESHTGVLSIHRTVLYTACFN